MTTLNASQIAEAARAGGFSEAQIPIAVAVALAESGGRTDARLTSSVEDSIGLWQINTKAHPQFDKVRLTEAVYNAQAAHSVWAGSGWGAWTTYTSGKYKSVDTSTVSTSTGTAATTVGLTDSFATLTSQKFWIRVAMVLLGGGLVIVGLSAMVGKPLTKVAL
jgi:hypothetical protein